MYCPSAEAQADRNHPTYYVVVPRAVVYQAADTTRPYLEVTLREQVSVIEKGPRWSLVRTTDGARGQIRTDRLSNVWIRVSKQAQTVFVYEGGELLHRIPADLGTNFFADKERRGSPDEPDHWRTPEGTFFVASKNPRSRYYRALVLNYPNAEDAARGLRDSLITESQFAAIVAAERKFGMPPMGTPLGGWIEIHGNGTGRRMNWTQGCIAIPDTTIDVLWPFVFVGTPVVIEP
jgi:murein L,D-transpeptidase YafK